MWLTAPEVEIPVERASVQAEEPSVLLRDWSPVGAGPPWGSGDLGEPGTPKPQTRLGQLFHSLLGYAVYFTCHPCGYKSQNVQESQKAVPFV